MANRAELLLHNQPSSCFGAVLNVAPHVYADALAKITEHNATAYLVNTGWIGGEYGVGKRISIKDTRAIITAILNDDLVNQETTLIKPFNLAVPTAVPNVDSKILIPENAWKDKEAYAANAKKLANSFIQNFENFTETEAGKNLVKYGPIL